MFRKDILVGSCSISISNVKNFKIAKNLDIYNKKSESVGSLDIILKIKRKDIRRENKEDQGTKYEIQCDVSPSISLENEEEEIEEEIDDDGKYFTLIPKNATFFSLFSLCN